MKKRCFLRITRPTVLSVEVPRAAAQTPVGACDPGINATTPPHVRDTPCPVCGRAPQAPQTSSSSLPTRRPPRELPGLSWPEGSLLSLLSPEVAGKWPQNGDTQRLRRAPAAVLSRTQPCCFDACTWRAQPSSCDRLTLSHSWGQPGWAAWAEVSPLAPRPAATRNANCCQPPTQGKGGAAWLLHPPSRGQPLAAGRQGGAGLASHLGMSDRGLGADQGLRTEDTV